MTKQVPGSPYDGPPLSWRPAPPRPARRRRSELAVPGSNPRMMQGAATSDADAVFLDLEDSVAPSEKVTSRARIVQALNENDYGDKATVVRINDLSTQWAVRDVVDVVEGAGAKLEAIMLPKTRGPEDVAALDIMLTSLEQQLGLTHTIGIEAQIETAAGISSVEKIAHASKRLIALVFGPGDYAAYADMPVLSIGAHDFAYPGHIYHFALQRIVTAAKAAGLQTIDGPFGKFRDLEALRNSAQMAPPTGLRWQVGRASGADSGAERSVLTVRCGDREGHRHPRPLLPGNGGRRAGRSGTRRRGDAGRGKPQAGRGRPAAGRG